MAFVTVKLEGGKNLQKALKRMNPQQNSRIFVKSVRQVAVLIAANARNVQIRRGGGAVHPAQLTHRTFTLRDSIAPDFEGLPRFAEVGTEKFYGAIHELGIGNHPARPFMAPALEDVRPKIPQIVVRNWKREARL
jgi:phage gpG-like protein